MMASIAPVGPAPMTTASRPVMSDGRWLRVSPKRDLEDGVGGRCRNRPATLKSRQREQVVPFLDRSLLPSEEEHHHHVHGLVWMGNISGRNDLLDDQEL